MSWKSIGKRSLFCIPAGCSLNFICSEPGKVTENCSEVINGFLSDVAETGKAVKDSEAEAIVGYLDSLPNQSANSNGAAFTSYLDALSTGCVPPPPSSEAVNGYLNELKQEDGGQFEKNEYYKEREPMLSPSECPRLCVSLLHTALTQSCALTRIIETIQSRP